MSKKLSIKDRVQLVLEYGTQYPEKWIGITKCQDPPPNNNSFGWAREWRKLATHHENETTILLEIIEELRQQILRP